MSAWEERGPNIYPPVWASRWGDDEYGLWADLCFQVGFEDQITQRFRWIEPGEFTMGSPLSEIDRSIAEGKSRRVKISQGFWLADTACMQAIWQVVMHSNPAHFQSELGYRSQYPVERVSWLMVQEFLQRLTKILPSDFPTLPTEAEWEYCCRAGSETPFHFGAQINSVQVNYDARLPYGAGKTGQFRGGTIGVKALLPNAWGVFQMHGNVWEWCCDPWRDFSTHPMPSFALDPGIEYSSPLTNYDKETSRILRGGSWVDDASNVRSASRVRIMPGRRYYFTGFRFVLRLGASLKK